MAIGAIGGGFIFLRQRNEAITMMGQLQGQLAGMQRQLEHATSEIASLENRVRELTEQVHAKT